MSSQSGDSDSSLGLDDLPELCLSKIMHSLASVKDRIAVLRASPRVYRMCVGPKAEKGILGKLALTTHLTSRVSLGPSKDAFTLGFRGLSPAAFEARWQEADHFLSLYLHSFSSISVAGNSVLRNEVYSILLPKLLILLDMHSWQGDLSICYLDIDISLSDSAADEDFLGLADQEEISLDDIDLIPLSSFISLLSNYGKRQAGVSSISLSTYVAVLLAFSKELSLIPNLRLKVQDLYNKKGFKRISIPSCVSVDLIESPSSKNMAHFASAFPNLKSLSSHSRLPSAGLASSFGLSDASPVIPLFPKSLEKLDIPLDSHIIPQLNLLNSHCPNLSHLVFRFQSSEIYAEHEYDELMSLLPPYNLPRSPKPSGSASLPSVKTLELHAGYDFQPDHWEMERCVFELTALVSRLSFPNLENYIAFLFTGQPEPPHGEAILMVLPNHFCLDRFPSLKSVSISAVHQNSVSEESDDEPSLMFLVMGELSASGALPKLEKFELSVSVLEQEALGGRTDPRFYEYYYGEGDDYEDESEEEEEGAREGPDTQSDPPTVIEISTEIVFPPQCRQVRKSSSFERVLEMKPGSTTSGTIRWTITKRLKATAN